MYLTNGMAAEFLFKPLERFAHIQVSLIYVFIALPNPFARELFHKLNRFAIYVAIYLEITVIDAQVDVSEPAL